MSFEYHINLDNEILVVGFRGRLMEREEAAGMLAELEEHFLDGYSNVVIDLSKLDYMNSSGLNVMINLLTKARKEGGDVILSNVSKKIETLFLMTKLNTVFSVAESREEAINQLKLKEQQP